jgi:hypothetical protein
LCVFCFDSEWFSQAFKEETQNNCFVVHFGLTLRNVQRTFLFILENLNLPPTPSFAVELIKIQSKQRQRKVGGHEKLAKAMYSGVGFDEFETFTERVETHHDTRILKNGLS